MEKIIFLGDSITEGFTLLKGHHNIINMGIGGNRTTDIIKRLDTVIHHNPEKLFLMIGINDYMTNNDIWFNDKPIDTLKNYETILNYLLNNLHCKNIYIMSILPILSGEIVKEELVSRFNKEIDELNTKINLLVNKYHLSYIDLNKDFKDEHNRLIKEYTTDGVHLSNLGYELFYKKILKLIE